MRYLKRFEDLSDDYRETFRDTVWTFNSFRSVGGKVEKLTLRYLKTTNIVDFEYDMATITIGARTREFKIYLPKPKYAGTFMNDIDAVIEILDLIEKYIKNIEKIRDNNSLFDRNNIDEYKLILRSLKVFNNVSDIEKFNDDCDEFFKKYDYLINADDMGLL